MSAPSLDRRSSPSAALGELVSSLADHIDPGPATYPDRLARDLDLPDRSFHEARAEAAARGGFPPYADLASYRRAHAEGLFDGADIAEAIARCPVTLGGADRPILGAALPASRALETALRVALEEDGGVTLDPVLLDACAARVADLGPTPVVRLGACEPRHRDALVRAGASDPDPEVHAVLAAYVKAYVEGRAKSAGFYAAVRDDVLLDACARPAWRATFDGAMALQRRAPTDPLEALGSALDTLGVSPGRREAFLRALIRTERHTIARVARAWEPSRGGRGARHAAAVEVLAVRCWLDVFAIRAAARAAEMHVGDLGELLGPAPRATVEVPVPERAVALARLLAGAGLDARALAGASAADLRNLFALLDRFDAVGRGRVLQDAFDLGRMRRIGATGGATAPDEPAASPVREAVAMGPSLVVVGRSLPPVPAGHEHVLFLAYDAEGDADGAELARIAASIPAIVRRRFERVLLGAGASSLAAAALTEEVLGDFGVAGASLDAVALTVSAAGEPPQPGPVIVAIEADDARIAALVARDALLAALEVLGFLTLARGERGSAGLVVSRFDRRQRFSLPFSSSRH